MIKGLAILFCNIVQNFVVIPITRWAAREEFEKLGKFYTAKPGHVEPVLSINQAVVLRSRDDMVELWERDPEAAQGQLNACLLALRAEPLSNSIVGLFGSLMTQGYDPSEAILRGHANTLMLGMFVRSRLDRADDSLVAAIQRDSSGSSPGSC